MNPVRLSEKDALIIVDVQNDFLPGGNLAIPDGDAVIPVLNRYIALFAARNLPVYATRDWHPENHCSFKPNGGTWPPHCVAHSDGARFAAGLALPEGVIVVSKATTPDKDAYSGFEGTALDHDLHAHHVERVFVGGLATDYCVLNTVMDALRHGFDVRLLLDAIRAVNVHSGDEQAAIEEMTKSGARPVTLAAVAAAMPPAGPHRQHNGSRQRHLQQLSGG